MTQTYNMVIRNFALRFAALLFPAVMVYIIITDGDGCGDLPRDFKFFPIAGGAAFLLAVLWSVIDRRRREPAGLRYALQILVRYFLAFIILQYGIAKVIDMQFSPSLSNLDTRVADMSAMGVAWSFFGYSFQYEFFIGCSQIIAGLLLVWRRTSTLGAIMMVVIMANIVFVNFAFDVCVKFFSTTYLVMSLYLLIDDAERLINLLILNKTAEKRIYPSLFRSKRGNRIFLFFCGLVLLVALGYPTYKTLHMKIEYGLGKHTALYGVWAVDSVHAKRSAMDSLLHTDRSGWKKFLFEDFKNASIRSGESAPGFYSYEVDTAKRLLTMRQTYPDTLSSLTMTYSVHHDTLLIGGRYNSDSVYARMHVLKKYFRR